MTGWGSKRPYKISRLRLDMNPIKAKFSNDGNSMSIFDYFKEKYDIDLEKN
jgi:hypothetical protein